MRAREPRQADPTRLLLGLRRRDLGRLLDMLREGLDRKSIAPPDPALPDNLYIDHASRILQSVGFRPWHLRPFSETSEVRSPDQLSTLDSQVSLISRYSLRRGLGVWQLTFAGKDAPLKHEQGILYVAYLLYNPPEQPIHALDLIARIPDLYRKQLGIPQITDPSTGKAAPLLSCARIQERSLALDDAQTMRALLPKQKELEAILDDESESEPVKAEALREYEAIAEFQKQHGARHKDAAQRSALTVRQAITRLHGRLAAALDRSGKPDPVLRAFALHIHQHILIPSARYSGHGGPHARTGLPGCFTYEPPPSVAWTNC